MYIKFNDAGHGWLRVKTEELKKLGIADKITSCSYIKGNYAYLEEDCDMGTFIDAKFNNIEEKVLFMKNVRISNCNNESGIRNYERYKNYSEDEIIRFNKIRNYLLGKFTGKKSQRIIKRGKFEDLNRWNIEFNLGY